MVSPEIEACETTLTKWVQEYHASLDDPQLNSPRQVSRMREDIQKQWKHYLEITNNSPSDKVKARVRTVAYLSLV